MNKTTRAAALPGRALPPAIPQPVWSGPIPDYVLKHYWWAYVHPRGVKFFDREWMVNLILFGNMARLRDGALDEIGALIHGRTLQVACVYGDFTPKLAERLAPGASLDVVDITPIQLTNTRRKIAPSAPVTFHHRDSTALAFDDSAFDQVVVFFLLHEQPDKVKARTLSEAARVLRPGGKLVLADYHRPHWWSPMRYLFRPILGKLEPFAPVLWDREIASWLPRDRKVVSLSKKTFFGGQYQTIAFTLG